jgi:endonuclease/exonuclease/phosphatase family metal-dependent hydrolase
VRKTGSGRWKEYLVDLPGSAFHGMLERRSDLALVATGENDTTFHMVEIIRAGKNKFNLKVHAETPYPTPSDHIRIISWNIEQLGKRSPIRTTAQRKLVGERMLDMNAAVFLLQEIGHTGKFNGIAFATVVNRMNELSSDKWTFYRNGMQNALVYNTNKLEIIEAPKHWPDSGDANYPQSSSRPPVTAVFKAVGGTLSFRVIGIHADPYDEQARITQAQWLNNKIQDLLNDSGETHNIILCGDYNTGGDHQDGLLQVFDDGKIVFNVPKENGPGTGWNKREESDYFSATSSGMAKIKGGTCYVNEPEEFKETYLEFEETYSDHFPVFIDISTDTAIPSI